MIGLTKRQITMLRLKIWASVRRCRRRQRDKTPAPAIRIARSVEARAPRPRLCAKPDSDQLRADSLP